MGCNPLALEKRFYLTISCKLYMLSQGADKKRMGVRLCGASVIFSSYVFIVGGGEPPKCVADPLLARFHFCVSWGDLGVNIVVVTEQ